MLAYEHAPMRHGHAEVLLPMIDPAIAAGSTAIAVVNYIFNGSGRKYCRGQEGYDGSGSELFH